MHISTHIRRCAATPRKHPSQYAAPAPGVSSVPAGNPHHKGPEQLRCFHHQPDLKHRPDSRLDADKAIQNIVDLLAAA
jgi:hypothetical protein